MGCGGGEGGCIFRIFMSVDGGGGDRQVWRHVIIFQFIRWLQLARRSLKTSSKSLMPFYMAVLKTKQSLTL